MVVIGDTNQILRNTNPTSRTRDTRTLVFSCLACSRVRVFVYMSLKNMKIFTLFFILALPLTAFSCSCPQRIRSIIPPTSEQELCRYDENFYYSTTFDFCFEYDSDEWKKARVSLPKDVAGTTLTSIDFLLPDKEEQYHLVFTLYLAGPTEQNISLFKDENIATVPDTDPYLMGYRITNKNSLPEKIQPLVDEIPEMLTGIDVFTKTPI